MKVEENIWIKVIEQLNNGELPDQQLLEQLSPEERELIDALQSDKMISRANILIDKIDEHKVWNNIKPNFEVKRISLIPKLLKYAAALLLPVFLIAGGVFYYLKNNKPVELNLAQLPPTDHKRATLVLSDGRSVELSKEGDQNLAELGGTSVINKNKEELSYQQNGNTSTATQIFNKLIIPRGAEYKLVLADGTVVMINSSSVLRFPVNFNGAATREVYLESGEAYFKVSKNKEIPFIVHSGIMAIKVLGTSFNVNTYSKNIKTTLVEGHVQINAGGKSLDLLPNQQAIFNPESTNLSKDDVDVESDVAWKEGWMIFSNSELKDVMEQLGRWYDYNIVFQSEKLKQVHFGGKLRKYNEVGTLLSIIEKTGSVNIEVRNQTIYIKEIPKNP
nr:FecR family protein [Pedobacter panaciterrae]